MELATQYDGFAQDFSALHDVGSNSNSHNRAIFYERIPHLNPGTRVLDLGCGDGLDLAYYQSLGAEVYGIDASSEMVELANSRVPGADIRLGTFDAIPFADGFFDVVLSKYALQTAPDLRPCFREIHRVLKEHGTLAYLAVHPMRHFIEKKSASADYFAQEVVESRILNDAIVVYEPSHTFNEYLNAWFFDRFDLADYSEHWDPAAEQIAGERYPGYFIAVATKRPALEIAVLSSAASAVSAENAALATEIGAYLAERNVTVVTGGSDGIPGLVVQAAYGRGADTVVYSPDSDEHSHRRRPDNFPLEFFKKQHFIHGFTARSLQMLKDADGALVLNGRMGTLSEFSIALEEGQRVAVVTGTGGVADHLPEIVATSNKELRQSVVFDADYKKAIDTLIAEIRNKK